MSAKQTIQLCDGCVRERLTLEGPCGLVVVTVQMLKQQSLRYYWHLDANSAGLSIDYVGHKDALAAIGATKILPPKPRWDRFCDDGFGGVWVLSSKAGPGRRGYVSMDYYTCNRAFARLLPGVEAHWPELLPLLSTPRLRLVSSTEMAS